MRRYESYKDSGVDWLGEVPSHWELKRLKQLFVEKKHKQSLSLNCGAISFGKVIEKSDDKVTEATKRSYQEVLKGEFLINPLNLNYDLISLRIALSEIDVVVSAGYIVLKEKQIINKKYFSYLLHRYDVAYMKLLGSGVRQTINYGHISDSILVIPPLSEQQKIAQFLDDKTAKIDQAVDLAEKQIALLKEHKQILIQNAVTRGLNPDVPLKDSGVEWIGQVPEHWESFRFKRVVEKVKDGTHGTHSRTEQGYPLLSAKNIFNNGIQITDNESLISEYDFKLITSNGFPRKNDLLVTCVGSIGRCCIYPFDEPIAFQRSVAFLRLNKKAFPGFYRYFIESNCYQEQLKTNTKLSIQGGVYLGTLIDLYVCFPPLLEQQTITIYLDTQTAKIDQAIALKTAHIEKLKEYKSVLINDVVTGKVQV